MGLDLYERWFLGISSFEMVVKIIRVDEIV